MIVGGKDEIDEDQAASYIERELKRDRDLWVLEIEDYNQRYQLDGPLTA